MLLTYENVVVVDIVNIHFVVLNAVVNVVVAIDTVLVNAVIGFTLVVQLLLTFYALWTSKSQDFVRGPFSC